VNTSAVFDPTTGAQTNANFGKVTAARNERRMQMALGVGSLDEIANRIHEFLNVKSPEGLLDKMKMLPMLAEMGSFFPKVVSTGPCKEVIKKGSDVNLADFPVLKCWPLDGGPFITFPEVITRDPNTGKRNVCTYRKEGFGPKFTGMQWQGH